MNIFSRNFNSTIIFCAIIYVVIYNTSAHKLHSISEQGILHCVICQFLSQNITIRALGVWICETVTNIHTTTVIHKSILHFHLTLHIITHATLLNRYFGTTSQICTKYYISPISSCVGPKPFDWHIV